MKEKKRKHDKKSKRKEPKRKKRSKDSSSSSSDSDEWVEKKVKQKTPDREDWMGMTGMLKTYSKEDLKSNNELKDKKQLDSYNPGTSSRELNPYWKNGGSGVPLSADSFKKSCKFLKPSQNDDFYSKNTSRSEDKYCNSTYNVNKYENNLDNKTPSSKSIKTSQSSSKSYNWKNESISNKSNQSLQDSTFDKIIKPVASEETDKIENKYLSDEKMNKLAAKIVKAEIMGDQKLVKDLKSKLESAREYRKNHPLEENDDRVLLISTTSMGNSRPLSKSDGDARSKGAKRKSETHISGERMKYYGDDDKCNLAEMFEQEKYGTNYGDEAELAKVSGKLKNPNDDLEDIFVDEISKSRNSAKDSEREKQRAINQHVKMEKSLEGCEYCVDSKNMIKHLMVSCGNKVYISLPAKKSMVTGQCIITTIQHSSCSTALDEDVWAEILDYRKALTNYYNSINQDVVFFETATRLHKFPHMVIKCLPMPRDVGDVAAIYFKKALLECEAEWSMNKKVVDLKGKDIRKGIPKGLPYFWIDFGMEPGFAHVIEDQHLFPRTFAEEVIAGILDLDHNSWKNPQREKGDLQRKKVIDFIREWRPFDNVTNSSCSTINK